jgi:hypothetical protein
VTDAIDPTLKYRYPHPARIDTAIRLAKDIQTCEALLHGEPVNPDRVDKAELERAATRRLVRLDFTALDLL